MFTAEDGDLNVLLGHGRIPMAVAQRDVSNLIAEACLSKFSARRLIRSSASARAILFVLHSKSACIASGEFA
jgi:hypothetical protein